jgi:ABC-type nitrate/sulfonate/bicarbonate transport system substrate-binding protein
VNADQLLKRRAADKARYEANPEKFKAAAKSWRAANPEKARAADKARYDANPEKIASATKAWRAANPEKSMAYGKSRRAANPEKTAAYAKAWAAANPEKVRAKWKAWNDANCVALSRSYVANRIGLPVAILSSDMYEIKREQLQISRLLRELNKELKETK